MAQYQFVDTWHLAADIERVYELVGEPLQYPRWWGDVWLSAEGDGGEPRPGKHIEVVTRGFLPYRIRWSLTCLEADRPSRITSRMEGDFEGTATWLLSEADGRVTAQLDFRPDVRKPGVRQLTPVLRPLFSANHRWAMRRGEEGAVRALAPS
jgi:uncharacterized protein YndB with AHSA1/START domain